MLKNLRNILPLPRGWKDDELRFGTRLNDAVTELLKNVRRLMALIAPESKQVVSTDMLLTDAQKRAAVENLGASKWIWLAPADNTWAAIWAKLNWINSGDVVPIYIAEAAMSVLSDGALVSDFSGTVGKTGNTFYFNLVSSNSSIQHVTMYINATESGITSRSMNNYETRIAELEDNAIVKTAQTLTSAEQTQVRTNLGLGAASTKAVANNVTTTAAGSVLDARQGKALNDSIEALSSNYANKGNGGEHTPAFYALTIVGRADVGSDVLTWGGGNESASSGNNAGGILYDHATRRYQFRAKDTSNTYYHQYMLPDCSSASSNKNYDILTSEVYPFGRIAGASPGGSSNKITFNAPGDGRHAILCYAMNMSHIFHLNATDSTVYSDGIASGFTLTKSNATYTLTRSNTIVFNYIVLWI